MNRNHINLGIFGFGVVGQGLYSVLNQTRGIHATVKKICIKHPEKTRSIDASYFTNNRDDILNDPDVNVIVELINDADSMTDCDISNNGVFRNGLTTLCETSHDMLSRGLSLASFFVRLVLF